MSKKLLVIVTVGCLLAGFAVGLVVRWPFIGSGSSGGAALLQSPTKGPDDPLVTIIEISEFQ
jgi:hypothetical protein